MTASTSTDARDAWRTAARGGFAVSGLLHLVLAYLIVRIAIGSSAEADQSTALSRLQDLPLGTALLWIAAAALVALGLWQLADALRDGDLKDRGKAAAKGVLYLALAGTTVSVILGSSGGGDGQATGFASTLMAAPAGRLLVGLIGLGIVAGGAYHVHKGVTKGFEEDLKTPSHEEVGTGIRVTGTIGYVGKGLALGAVGVLFAIAAIQADPDEAKGVDGALEALLGLPGGPALVAAIGVGFAAYGLYSFGRARYARL